MKKLLVVLPILLISCSNKCDGIKAGDVVKDKFTHEKLLVEGTNHANTHIWVRTKNHRELKISCDEVLIIPNKSLMTPELKNKTN